MALKRDSQSSIFDTLAPKESINASKEAAKGKIAPSKEPAKKPKIAEIKENPKKEPKAEKATEITEIHEKAEPVATPVMEEAPKKPIKAFDFGENKVRELKKVRKQFVFTKTYAEWISATAKYNNMSENQVIENLIRMAMEKQ